MRFNLRKPCDNCPFRSDKPFYGLGPERVREIAECDGTFPCHKTTDLDTEDGEARVLPTSSHCAGFLIFRERLEQPSQMMRIAERLGLYDRHKLDMTAPVYDSVEAMVDGQRLTHPAKRGKVTDEGPTSQGNYHDMSNKIFDELREAMFTYMADKGLSAAKMGALIGCSQQKIDSMRPQYVGHKPGSAPDPSRAPARESMREPALSNLVGLLREAGYIEKRILIPASERMNPDAKAEAAKRRKIERQRERRAEKRAGK